MTTKRQSGRDDVLPVSGGVYKAVAGDRKVVRVARKTQPHVTPRWTEEKLCAVSPFVVEGLFGKRHWAKRWVNELCETDPQFILHLADQPPGYVHFICLVRLALLERTADDADTAEYAKVIRTTSKKALLKKLFPTGPGGMLSVLPKLPEKPLAQKDYWQLQDVLRCDTMRKRLRHAKHVRKLDLYLGDIQERLYKEFSDGEVMLCIKSVDDYHQFCTFVRGANLLGLKITKRELKEINEVARTTKSMKKLSQWFVRKFTELPFPPPPWKGNAIIQPVRSLEELKAVGEKFKNCLRGDGYVHSAAMRGSYFYVCESPPAVIRLSSDALFGWVLEEIKGVRNREIPYNQHNQISQAFLDAGIVRKDNFNCLNTRNHWNW